jgi:hypothetical protein
MIDSRRRTWSSPIGQTTSTSGPSIDLSGPSIDRWLGVAATRQRTVVLPGAWTMPELLTQSDRRLDELARLPENWDSYGGARPSTASIVAARSLLLALYARGGVPFGREVNPSHIAPLPVGGVQLEWTGPSMDIEVEAGPGGKFAYLLDDRREGRQHCSEDDDVAAAVIVDLVMRVLSS